jgi:hypothetical protein
LQTVSIKAEDHTIDGEGGPGILVSEGHGLTWCENNTKLSEFAGGGLWTFDLARTG